MPTERLNEIPPAALKMIERNSGSIVETNAITGGLNSSIAARVCTEEGTLFVKGLPANHPRVWTQSREAAIAPYVHGLAPELLWQANGSDWHLLGFAYVEGRQASWKPGTDDLEPTLDVMQELAERPLPPVEVKRMTDRLRDYTENDELFLFDGSALLHTEWNPENVLVVDDNGVRLVDWAWVSLGAAWIDPALWVLWLIAAGHDCEEAEYAATGHKAWRTASYEALSAFSRAQARLWDSIAEQSTDAWPTAMQQAATMWRDYRN
ncbi:MULTISPECIES: aminoglycoside phosphotransferase [Streptomyces]